VPIDFTAIKSGEDFELLCEDLLQAMGFTIEAKVARGPDLGKDIIAVWTVPDPAGFSEAHRYLVECKHYAQSGKSVKEADIGSPIQCMGTHNCDRYILITSTVPAEKTRNELASMSNTVPHYKAIVWHKGDLARLLNAHPDVRGRHFPSPPSPTLADALAQTVESLLIMMGFTCQERQSGTDRVWMVCRGKGTFVRPTAVVCKEGKVAREDVEALLANVKAQGLGGGVLVTHTRVSPAARSRAAETRDLVRTFTLDEFYRELINFEPYVRRLVADYEEDELCTYYVDLGCRASGGSIYKPVDKYVDGWLGDPTHNHISILGDYGTGKTSFCRQYAAKLGRRWLDDPDHHRIPILISLRDYAKAMNLEQLVTDFLVNRCSIQARYEAFRRFNADGKLVLLFDGFDEMAQKVDDQTTMANFKELARTVEAKSKVILTCRTPYFRTQGEERQMLSPRERLPKSQEPVAGPHATVFELVDRPSFEVVYLEPFTDGDIQAVLQARFPERWEMHWKRIQQIYNLAELAQRPVLLDMIVRSLPQLERSHVINAARLYEVYTDLWLARDEEIGRTLINPDDKRLFMQALALEMLRRDELSIHYSQLPEQVRVHFRLEKAAEIDYFEHDVRTCSFLKRDDRGNYGFVHKSFQEFFVAQWLAPRLLDGSAPENQINEEIRRFVRELLVDAMKDWSPPPPEGTRVPEGIAWVPPGPFIYGEGKGTWVVRLDQGFFIDRTLVTNMEYARFVEVTGHEPPRHWNGKSPPDELCDHPVVNVSWYDAVAYAEWAGKRLPTEEEWEKAARGIDGREYPWGDWDERCNTREADIGGTTPVGQYSLDGDSLYGCADMAGNVWEWTSSSWAPGHTDRVVRGGAYLDGQDDARCACRVNCHPHQRLKDTGFRCISPVESVSRLTAQEFLQGLK